MGPDGRLELVFVGLVFLLVASVVTGWPFLYGLLLTIALVICVIAIFGPPEEPR